MRLLNLIAVFVVFAVFAAAQSQDICPKIEITGPRGVTNPTDELTFAVTLSSTPSNVKYDWKVSGGSIQSGQGTQSIVVRTSLADAGQKLEATVSIEGFPSICNAVVSETDQVAQALRVESLDDWGRIPNADQQARLDNFFISLEMNPNQYGVLYLSAAKKEGPSALNRRISLILGHAKFRKFDKNRLIFVLKSVDSHRTEVYRFSPEFWQSIECKPPCKVIYGRDLK